MNDKRFQKNTNKIRLRVRAKTMKKLLYNTAQDTHQNCSRSKTKDIFLSKVFLVLSVIYICGGTR